MKTPPMFKKTPTGFQTVRGCFKKHPQVLPITFKDFPCNFIVVSFCIVFPYHFYKYGMLLIRLFSHVFVINGTIFTRAYDLLL
jgi:hypothetical protein